MIEARDIRHSEGYSTNSLMKGRVLKMEESGSENNKCLEIYLDTGYVLFIKDKCLKDIKDYLFALTL